MPSEVIFSMIEDHAGYGFPLHCGSPMCLADQRGLYKVVQAMEKFAANPRADAAFWQPEPLLARLAA